MVQLLGNVAVGSIVKLKENGDAKEFYVAKHDYESSLNGAGRTLVVRKDCYDKRVWDNGNVNAYASSDLDSWFNSTYKNMLDADIRSLIGTTKIRYTPGNGNWTVGTLERAVFALSATELGQSASWFNVEGSALPIANTLKVAYLNGSANPQWTRSPLTNGTDNAVVLGSGGVVSSYFCSYFHGSRPAFTLPATTFVDDSNNIVQIPTISTITVPSFAMQGQSIPLSWTPVSLSGFDVTYQLQRNADNSGWTTIYTGADTSYTDTAGTWTQVQYQVAAVVEGTVGSYTQSTIIPVSDPSVLVISGQDGNLGTLTSNFPYTVSSNTGNPISLTRTVNGAQVVTLTVDSGFAYSIPIADLPTGTGTIQITASVESDSGTATQTRTWTYYKTPINIPSTGGIAQLTQNGQNIWPVTVPDAVEAPVYLGGNLNSALNKLGQAVLYSKIGAPKYNEININLANVSVGDEVNLPYNGVMVPHIVVQIGNPDSGMYDSSCDGVWLLRKDCVAIGAWNSSNVNAIIGSTIISNMTEYVTNYDITVQSAIRTVKIPYCIGGGNTTVNTLANGLQCQIFPLSGYELGWTTETSSSFPIDGTILSYFKGTESTDAKRIANLNNSPSLWWLRSPVINGTNHAWYVDTIGSRSSAFYVNADNVVAYRPCFVLPTTFTATYYVDSNNKVYPSQEYSQTSVITDVFGYDVPIPQIEVGSYVGTGTYGPNNKNSLTFSFVPKVLFIGNIALTSSRSGFFIWKSNGYSIFYGTNPTFYGLTTIYTNDGYNISWYGTSADIQLNNSSYTYGYYAFG